MISQIRLDKIATFKQAALLETDKRVNLIYGLNGTGKSTISNFFFNPSESRYGNCSHDGGEDLDVVVYNHRFVEETFYQSEGLPGIFTLSKENKDARTAIDQATNELHQLEAEKIAKEIALNAANKAVTSALDDSKNQTWEIKIKYSGGDRPLDFCLEGQKASSDRLFSTLRDYPMPRDKPTRTLAEIEAEARLLIGGGLTRLDLLPRLIFDGSSVEGESIFAEAIVGSGNATVASVIDRLDNSDWVRQGLQFIRVDPGQKNSMCPFCAEATISAEFRTTLTNYFDKAFEDRVKELSTQSAVYAKSIATLPDVEIYTTHSRLGTKLETFKSNFRALTLLFTNNLQLITEKISNPSRRVVLGDSSELIASLNDIINAVNGEVSEHNQKIDDSASHKQSIKSEFWNVVRWEYDAVFHKYAANHSECENRVDAAEKTLKDTKEEIAEKRNFIAEKQKATVNVDQAVQQINAMLADLGMHDFSITRKDGERALYRLIRQDHEEDVFTTLSEGEKMMISFLYFIELCRGKSSPDAVARKKVVVIDDPISSLSHIFVFNVGRLINLEFLRGDKYEQVFVLTHNLYFFHELTDINKERRERDQKLFRLLKNSEGSHIVAMKYEEIQNDYQTYWAVIKDEKQPGALIANCMRNIIEYFFGFVEKRDLNAVFTKPELQPIRFQAFNRYINRESHSLPQNIFDQKEFDYKDFKDALELVFKTTGYEKHYEKMAR